MTRQKYAIEKKLFSYFDTKTYVVDTQKNRLNETFLAPVGTQKNRVNEAVLLSTQDKC